MRPQVEKRTVSATELLERSVGVSRADALFRQMIASLPATGAARSAACRRLNRLTAAMVATKGGEGELHGLLAGSAAVAAPAYRTEKRFTEAEALFARPAEPDED